MSTILMLIVAVVAIMLLLAVLMPIFIFVLGFKVIKTVRDNPQPPRLEVQVRKDESV